MSSTSDNALVAYQLPVSDNVPLDPESIPLYLNNHVRRVSDAVNSKSSGLYILQETGSFKQMYTVGDPQTRRDVYRYVMDLVEENGGSLSAGSYSFAHNIDGLANGTPVMLSGAATDSAGIFFPLPHADATAANLNLQLTADSTNINLVVGAGVANALEQAYVVFEYTKN